MKIKNALLLLASLMTISLSSKKQSFDVAKADSQSRIWIAAQDNAVETYAYNAFVYMNLSEEISALSVDVHFDSVIIEVFDTTNSISSNIYDSSITTTSVNYSYIFNSVTTNSNTLLFRFTYRIASGVIPGQYFFDITINEAYNSSLEDVEISASRYYFNVSSVSSLKTSNATVVGSRYISTSYNEEFSFTYMLSNSEPTSGTFIIRYDDTLFEFVYFNKMNFFDGMICDYNSSASGEILVSFAEAVPNDNKNLFTITLRTIKNISTSSQITLIASELYDSDMTPMTFSAESVNVTISYDSSYEEHPSVTTNANVNAASNQIVFTINLEEDSHLGAADFVFKFDKSILTYVSYEFLISPTFAGVNSTSAQLEKGQVTFNIISTTDITAGGDILKLAFSYVDSRNNRNSSVELTGSGITDSLVNPIELDISGTSFVIPGVDLVQKWIDTYMYMNDDSFAGEGTGRCSSENLYETAKRELLKLDFKSIEDFESNNGNKYTDALARYQAWARANHDNHPFEVNYDFLNSPVGPIIKTESTDQQLVIVIVIFSSIIAIVCYLFIRKKKTNR